MASFAQPVPVMPLSGLPEADLDIVVECAPAALLRDIAEPALCGRAHADHAVLRRAARQFRPCRSGARARWAHPRADRRAVGPRRGAGGGAGHDRAGSHDHNKTARGARRRALSGRTGRLARWPRHGAARLRGQRPRGGARLSGECQRRCGAGVAGIGPDRTTIEIWADPRWTATSTASRSRPTRCASGWRSRTCRASRTPEPEG